MTIHSDLDPRMINAVITDFERRVFSTNVLGEQR